jgi:hypothetical protein
LYFLSRLPHSLPISPVLIRPWQVTKRSHVIALSLCLSTRALK